MLDTWTWTSEDGDNVTSDTLAKVHTALAQGARVFCMGDPVSGGIIAVMVQDASYDESGLPLVISDERELASA